MSDRVVRLVMRSFQADPKAAWAYMRCPTMGIFFQGKDEDHETYQRSNECRMVNRETEEKKKVGGLIHNVVARQSPNTQETKDR